MNVPGQTILLLGYPRRLRVSKASISNRELKSVRNKNRSINWTYLHPSWCCSLPSDPKRARRWPLSRCNRSFALSIATLQIFRFRQSSCSISGCRGSWEERKRLFRRRAGTFVVVHFATLAWNQEKKKTRSVTRTLVKKTFQNAPSIHSRLGRLSGLPAGRSRRRSITPATLL